MSSNSDNDHVATLYARIYDVVRQIPHGTVATYGQVAELAGIRRGARVVGYALKRASPHTLPWQRVIGRRSKTMGHVTIQDPIGGATQRTRLENEGIAFTKTDGIQLRDFGWLPVDE